MGQELTTANKILVAASHLDEERETFTAEDLIVRAWNQFPESFGLSGYREKYPDSNRVLSKLMGSVGLCARAWLEQVSTKTYKMTPAGRKLATTLRHMLANADAVTPADATPAPAAPRASRPTPVAKPAPREREVEKSRVEPAVARAKPREIEEASPRLAAVSPRVDKSSPMSPRVDRDRIAASAARVERERAASRVDREPEPKPRVASVPAPPPAPVHRAPEPVRAVPAPVRISEVGGKFEGVPALQRLVMSPASQKFTRGGLVTFADACQFWAITPSIHPMHLAPRLEEIETVLRRAEAHISSNGAGIKVHDRLEVTLTNVIGLQGLHKMLTQKYHRELDGIRVRGITSSSGGGDD